MSRTILSLIAAQANEHPAATAIAAPGRPPLSYAALCDFVSTSAARLRGLGVARGSRVAMVIPNGPEAATAFLAVSHCATAAPFNPGYKENEFASHFSDLDVRALLIPSDFDSPSRDAARQLGIPVIEIRIHSAAAGIFSLPDSPGVDRDAAFADAGDFAIALHTSGTTGRSKQFLLTHHNVCVAMNNTRQALELTAQDRCLNVMPMFHTGGLVVAVLSSLHAGASVCCAPGFVATRYFDWLAEWRPTWFTAVPAMLQSMLARAPEHRELIAQLPLRFIRSGSAPLLVPLLHELEATFAVPLIEVYGLGETSTMVTSNPLPPRERKPGSVGVPIGAEVAIMDEEGRLLASPQSGEVVVRGETVFGGYHNDPESNPRVFAHGWFHTGDLGHFDADGYLYLDGRLKEVINRGGEKVLPREVEEVLLDHPNVAEAAAFPMPDTRLGQVVAAVVVPRGEVSEAELRDTLREHAAKRLAEYKVPACIVIREEIPKNALGKVQRFQLADQLGLAADAAESAIYEAPATDLETRLAAIWKECLRIERVGRHDRFLDLGGDSILAAQIVERTNAGGSGRQVRLLDFFTNPTIAGLAASMEAAKSAVRSSLVELCGGTGDPFFCVPGAVGRVWGLRQLAAHFHGHTPFYAFDALEADEVDAATFSIASVAAAYIAEMKMRQPRGPYYVGGACWGALVAFEMAQQLAAAGDQLGLVALIDPNPLTPNGFEVAARRDLQRRLERMSSADFKERAALLWSVFRSVERKVRAPLGLIRRSPGQRLADTETWRTIAGWDGTMLRLKAQDAYQASAYDGAITLVLAAHNTDGSNDIRRDDWRAMAREYRELLVEGEHMMWMREPDVGRLARVLLDAVGAERARGRQSVKA